jgi:diguanylate cyclase (GGDEF)-like protein
MQAHSVASRARHQDLLRLALGRPCVVARSVVPWLPDLFGQPADRLGDSVVLMPMRRSGDLIGVAAGLPSKEAEARLSDLAREATAGLLEALADQIALATEFARSTSDAQHSARRFALLASLAEIALAKMGATEMIDAILARVRDHFDAHKVSLLLLHGSRGSLGTRSVQRPEPARGQLPAMRVPLTWEDRLIGSLVLRRTQPIDIGEEETLALVADQIALALSTSGRYQFQAAMAVLDQLTELPNRRSAEATLDSELTRASQDPDALLCVALVDIDNFKGVNDTYGHEVGDAVLREVAAVFKAQLRGTDYVARWGGEEFLLIYRGHDLGRIQQVGERVRRALSQATVKVADGEKLSITASLGGAAYPMHGSTRDKLVVAADTALYDAKHAGRDRSAWHISAP